MPVTAALCHHRSWASACARHPACAPPAAASTSSATSTAATDQYTLIWHTLDQLNYVEATLAMCGAWCDALPSVCTLQVGDWMAFAVHWVGACEARAAAAATVGRAALALLRVCWEQVIDCRNVAQKSVSVGPAVPWLPSSLHWSLPQDVGHERKAFDVTPPQHCAYCGREDVNRGTLRPSV